MRRREPSEILLKRFRAAAAAFVLTLRKSYKKEVLRKNTHVHTHARAFKRAKSPAQSGVVIIRLIKSRCPLLRPPREKRGKEKRRKRRRKRVKKKARKRRRLLKSNQLGRQTWSVRYCNNPPVRRRRRHLGNTTAKAGITSTRRRCSITIRRPSCTFVAERING